MSAPNKIDKGDCQPLHRGKFKQAEAYRITYLITPAAGTPMKRILKRDYWTNIAPVLTKAAKIEVVPEDGEYYAELIVTAFGKNWADVVLHGEVTYLNRGEPIPEDSEFFIKYRGVISGHAVIRKSDKQVIKDGFQTWAVAKQWLEQHEKK